MKHINMWKLHKSKLQKLGITKNQYLTYLKVDNAITNSGCITRYVNGDALNAFQVNASSIII